MEYVEVQDVTVPALGFGTWQLRHQACYDGVRHALELGYRHIDTAQMYENEQEVGRALDDADVDRDEVFLVTKIPPRNLRPRDVHSSHDASLDALGTDTVDLLLIHWPTRSVPLGATLEAMRQLRDQGKARHLGVSNFTPSLVDEALEHAPIVCNQVEYHPLLDQRPLVDQALERDLVLTAYSPLAKGRVLDDPTLKEIGEVHGKTPAQVALRWLIQQRNVAVIPRSSSPEHRADNFAVWDFDLSDDEVRRIDGLARGERLIDPGFAPEWET